MPRLWDEKEAGRRDGGALRPGPSGASRTIIRRRLISGLPSPATLIRPPLTNASAPPHRWGIV